MSQKERLIAKCEEVERSVRGLAKELKAITKRNIKSKDKDYNEWVYNQHFEHDDVFYGATNKEIGSCMNELYTLISQLTNQDAVRYVDFDLVSWKPIERYICRNMFTDSIISEFITCPDCGSFIKPGCPTCICGHKFSDDSVVCFQGYGAYDRVFKEENGVVKHEVFIDDKRYTAIYKVEDIKDIADNEGLELELPAINAGLCRDNDFNSFIVRKRKEFEAAEPQTQLELSESMPEGHTTWMDYIKIASVDKSGQYWYPFQRTENGIEPVIVEDEEE